MSIFIPPNLDPVATISDSSTSYTVPSGKFAIITICLSATAYTYVSSGSPSGSQHHNSSNSAVVEIRLKSGDVLAKNENAASGSTSTTFIAVQGGSSSSVSVQIGGIGTPHVIAQIVSSASGFFEAGAGTITLTGTANVNWLISEYNKLT